MTFTRRGFMSLIGATGLWGLDAAAQTPDAAAPKTARPKFAITGATWWQVDGTKTKDTVIVVDPAIGRIVSIGTDPPGDVSRIDIGGKIITGGFADPLTAIGLIEISLEPTTRDDALAGDELVRAAFRTADGYNPASSLVNIARIEGLTNAGVIPTEGLVAGQSCWVDLAGATPDEAIGKRTSALHVIFGGRSLEDSSRGTALLRLRELFEDTRTFQNNQRDYERRQLRKLGASRLDYEVVARALDGQLPTVVHADRASDILNVLALAKDSGLKLILASAAEGWKVADQIRDADVGVIVFGLDHGPRSFAALGAREDNAKLLDEAGVRVALSTGESHNARKLRQVAGNAVRAGLPQHVALGAVSDTAAQLLGLGDDYGEPKVGRMANLVVWSGDPFEFSSNAELMYIRGREVALTSRQTALYDRYK